MPTIGATALAACSSMLTRKSDATADILGETLDDAGQGGAALTGTIYLPEERISVADSVRAYTKGSAFAAFSDKQVGTLEVGKLADLAVLPQDIFSVPSHLNFIRPSTPAVSG